MNLMDDSGSYTMIIQKQYATVFEGTRDYMDGLCCGLTIHSLPEKFEPEQIIHVQQPANAKVDDIPAGN